MVKVDVECSGNLQAPTDQISPKRGHQGHPGACIFVHAPSGICAEYLLLKKRNVLLQLSHMGH